MGATAAMMAAVRAIATKDGAIDDPFAEPPSGCTHDPAKPSAWIAEGLFDYLPPEAQDRLLDAVIELAAPDSLIVAERGAHQPAGRPPTALRRTGGSVPCA